VAENAPYRRNPDVSWRTIEGQAVLILNREGEVQVLNEVGTYVWEHLELSPDEMARNIASEYDVPGEEAHGDVVRFIEELKASGAIQEGNG
jgi:DNA-binding GntR family transcriptional regulator